MHFLILRKFELEFCNFYRIIDKKNMNKRILLWVIFFRSYEVLQNSS